MAEAVASLGLAANIIQFIQFGSKFSTSFWAFYQSNRDTFEAVPDIKALTTDLSDILASLKLPEGQANQAEQGLQLLVTECHEVAEQLHQLLTSLAPNGPKPGKLAALKSSWKLLWKEDDIQKLQARLEAFRSQLLVHMVSILRTESQKTEAHQKSMLQKLDELLQTKTVTDYRPIGLQIDLDGLGSLLVKRLVAKSSAEQLPQLEQEWKAGLISSINQNGPSLAVAEANPTISHQRHVTLQRKFLSRFTYSGMGDREFRIAEAHQQTFQWIFEDSTGANRKWSNFREFLESDSKLYWITGKPGSGKSTLMKYISHPRTEPRYRKHLLRWAADFELVVANFYFWNSGLEIQMSIRGLLLSLLRQLLTNDLSMIPVISPTRWESLCLFNEDDDSLSNSELENMLRMFAQHLPTKTKVFFLIDGLDEFDGDHQHLASFLVALLDSPNIKMCVASRPWTVFEETFQHSPSLMLQDLTRKDIRFYVTSIMVAEPTFSLLQKREPKYADELIEHIVSKASGVFLWVNLVVQSLLAGIGYGDRILDLQRRLEQLPPDLENLYDKIMSSLDPFYLEHAAQLFQIFESFDEPPTILLMAFADEEWRHAVDRAIRPLSGEEVEIMCDTMRRRINSRTKGFLEISRNTQGLKDGEQNVGSTVQYLHRTVRDYIKSKEVQNLLNARLKDSFDPYIQVCTAHLLRIKILGRWSLFSMELSQGSDINHGPALAPEFYPGAFWQHCAALLRSAAETRYASQLDVVALMDELDRAGSVLARQSAKLKLPNTGSENTGGVLLIGITPFWRQWYLENGLWVPFFFTGRGKAFGGTFLSLAVRYGVTAYVKAKAKPGCLIPKQSLPLVAPDYYSVSVKNSGLHSLLLDAVTSYQDSTLAPHWSKSSLKPSMVSCLLELGADFDWNKESDSHVLIASDNAVLIDYNIPWVALFASFSPGTVLDGSSNAVDLMSTEWRVVIETVLRQGKRPPASTIRRHLPLSSTKHVLINLILRIHADTGIAADTAAIIMETRFNKGAIPLEKSSENSKKSGGWPLAFWR